MSSVSAIDWNNLLSTMVSMQMVTTMMQAMQNALSGTSGMSSVTKVLEEILPIIILVKLFDKLG